MKRTTSFLLALTVAMIGLATPALADPKKGHPGGAQRGWIPPGLAKKPGGMPPGQFKKYYRADRGDYYDRDRRYRDDDWDGDRWDGDRRVYRYGDVLPGGYTFIDDYNRWRLPPPPPGQGYVRYDNEVYRVVRDTATVLEAIGIVSNLLN